MTPEIQRGILETARSLGMDPRVLATIISYETGGTFNPTQRGPTTQWGQHRGLIQFGEPQAKQYGVNWADPVRSQLGPNGAVARYYRQNGWKSGMSELDAYSIVNAGGPGRYNASDANNGGAPGTVADKVNKQFGAHRQKAAAMFGGLSFGPETPAAPTDAMGIAGMFGNAGLSMGAPADPFAAGMQRQAAVKEQRKDEQEANEVRRRALLSGVGAMFG